MGQEGQNKLLQAKVLVVGVGGLGCPALQYLVAGGIGTIGIVDFDVVEESNLQRQILFGTSSMGMNKAIAAKNRLEDLNPTIIINAYPEKLSSKNVLKLFNAYDIIVDCTDNFTTRYLINDVSIIANKPVVYGAIYKFEGQVSVFNYQDGPSYRCLFPIPPNSGSVANCSEVGVLGVLPGITGSMQANEVIKMILGFKDVLSGKLCCYDAKTCQTTTLKIQKSALQFDKVLAQKDDFDTYQEAIPCAISIPEISADEVLLKNNIQFIDVRELHEHPKLNIPNCIQIPLVELEENIDKVDSKKTNIIFCQTGIRSKKAIALLHKHYKTNCYSLIGGISTLIQQEKVKI